MNKSWIYVLLLSCLVLTAWATEETNDGHDDDANGVAATAEAKEEAKMKLKVTTLLVEPFMMEKNNSKEEMEFEGYLMDVLEVLAEKADFEYEIYVVEDGHYGQHRGSWNGLVGELVKGEADLAVAPLTRNEVRDKAVDFTPPFMKAPTTALVKAEWELKTIQCIVDWKDLNIVTLKDSNTFDTLRQIRTPPMNGIYTRIVNNQAPMPVTVEEGIEMVKSDEKNTTFIMEKPIADWAVEEDCDLATIKEFNIINFNQSYSFAMPKRHPKSQDIKKAMAEMFEDGTFERIQGDWWLNKCSNDSVTINKMSALFVALATLFCLLFAQL